MKPAVLVTAALAATLPVAAQAQSMWDTRPTFPGVYIGAQGA